MSMPAFIAELWSRELSEILAEFSLTEETLILSETSLIEEIAMAVGPLVFGITEVAIEVCSEVGCAMSSCGATLSKILPDSSSDELLSTDPNELVSSREDARSAGGGYK